MSVLTNTERSDFSWIKIYRSVIMIMRMMVDFAVREMNPQRFFRCCILTVISNMLVRKDVVNLIVVS